MALQILALTSMEGMLLAGVLKFVNERLVGHIGITPSIYG